MEYHIILAIFQTDMTTSPTGMMLDGIGGSEAIDSSGEILDISGADLSSYLNGTAPINYEHRSGDSHGASANDVIGRVVYAKKIYEEADCEDARQKMYWNLIKLPYIYVKGRLFDGSDHPGALAAAAMLRDAYANGEPPLLNWSVEGSTVSRKGNKLEATVLRAIALTVKPCNKSALSGILEDPNAPTGFNKEPGRKKEEAKDLLTGFIERATKNEMADPMFQRLNSVEHEYVPFEKALEAGNYNVPPSSLVGGAVLSTEHLRRKKIEDLTKRAKAAFRDWDKLEDIHKFLKFRLPDASEDFINHFADMANDWKLRKDEEEAQQLRKFEGLVVDLVTNLRKATATAPREVDYGGGKVGPGTATVGDKKYHVLEYKPGSHMVGVPEGKLDHFTPHDLERFDSKDVKVRELPKFKEHNEPVNALVHGDWAFNRSAEQHNLIHGLDLDQKHPGPTHATTGYGESKKYWVKNAAGKPVFIKEDEVHEHPKDDMSEPHKEVAYHNLAKDFFKLGDYLPQVAFFKHPKSGKDSVAVEGLVGDHTGSDHPVLHDLHQKGELDKLALMDHILHNGDRGTHNFLITKDHKLKLIDHGFAFDPASIPVHPDYYPHGDHNSPIHLEAQNWLSKLDPKELEHHLKANKVPPQERLAVMSRLKNTQEHLLGPTTPTRQSIGIF